MRRCGGCRSQHRTQIRQRGSLHYDPALLGVEVSIAGAVVIEAFSTAIRFATFMVPGSLGALEGGHVAIFVALGFTGTVGLSYSLVRRIREATWVGIGFVALVLLRPGHPALPVPTADG